MNILTQPYRQLQKRVNALPDPWPKTLFGWLVHFAAWFPFFHLLFDWSTDRLSINPIQDITFRTGKAALVLLVLSLAATPANTVFGFRPALKVRRALGLYAFMYASLHFLVFIGLDYVFDWSLILEAIFEKRYALVGFAAALIMLPLAITSTKGWMKRLGKNWRRLHKLVYLSGILAVIHYVWLVKSDIREPLAFGAAVGLLLVARIPAFRKRLSAARQRLNGWLRSRWNYWREPQHEVSQVEIRKSKISGLG